MITWMQKHNKWLVWTIWVATIAFIGAGFVGWGSYSYGSKASAVGAAGDIKISRERLNFAYSNLYDQYNNIFKGKFDEEQAKKMGLLKQAFNAQASQAQLLNLAKQYGVTVSEKELADYIATMPAFQGGGVFSKKVYKTYLQNRGLKNSFFEKILSDELTIQKLMNMLEYPSMPFENKSVASALSIEDKIAYKVLSPEDFQVDINDSELKQAWELNKNEYMSPKMYKLSIYWTDTKDINVSDKEISDFYDKNSFNYIDQTGKQLTLDQVKDRVVRDLKIKRGKKRALLDYIDVKKGKKSAQEEKTIPLNDLSLSKDLWTEITQSNAGTLLKPKPVDSRYATVKIVDVVEPKPLPFAEAKDAVKKRLQFSKSIEEMQKKAKEMEGNIDNIDNLTTSDYISLTKNVELAPLSREESLQFLQNLFTNSGKKGIIALSKHLVVYKIVDQRIASDDQNLTVNIAGEASNIKKSVFERALLKKLNDQFPIEVYVKGL